jgi:hypothetical protein
MTKQARIASPGMPPLGESNDRADAAELAQCMPGCFAMRRWFAVLASIGGLASAMAWNEWRHAQERADAQRMIAALKDEVGELHGAVTRQQATSSVVKTLSARRPADPSPNVAQPVAPEPEPVLTREQQQEQLAEHLEQAFYGESQDRRWATETTSAIQSTLAESVPEARVLETQCASSLCKVVLRHDSVDAQRKLGFTLGSRGPFRNGVHYLYDSASNPPTTTLYVMRGADAAEAHAEAR